MDDVGESAETYAHRLRLDLAALLGRGLDAKGWTQSRLAQEAGMQPPQVSRIINAGRNCTLESAARLLFALGISAKLLEAEYEVSAGSESIILKMDSAHHGSKEIITEKWSAGGDEARLG